MVDIGALTVVARANGFAGRSSAYFNASAILQFAERMAAYPLPDGEPLRIQSGMFPVNSDELEEHIGIGVAPVGSLVQVAVLVHLAEPWPQRSGNRADVHLELLTTYERLRRFSPELARVVRGEQSEARLGGEVLRGS